MIWLTLSLAVSLAGAKGVALSFSNQAQFLLISRASVKHMHVRMMERYPQMNWVSSNCPVCMCEVQKWCQLPPEDVAGIVYSVRLFSTCMSRGRIQTSP